MGEAQEFQECFMEGPWDNYKILEKEKSLMSKIKKILISVAMNGRKGEGKHNERVISQALQAIKSLLPKKKEVWRDATDYAGSFYSGSSEPPKKAVIKDKEAIGFNQAIDQMHKNIRKSNDSQRTYKRVREKSK